jgi:hypothetical protein
MSAGHSAVSVAAARPLPAIGSRDHAMGLERAG